MKARMRMARLVIALPLGALTLGSAGTAFSQDEIVVDCNIFYLNGGGECEAGDGETSPPLPFTSCSLINSVFPHNQITNPELVAPFDPLAPDFRPTPGGNSTYAGGAPVGIVPGDGFFTQPSFVGAMGPAANEDWTKPWCYYSPDGAGRTDLPPGPPVVVSGDITTNTTWTNNGLGYLLVGTVRVQPPAVLTINAGTVIFGEQASNGALIINQGARIVANGTAQQPIIFTSDALPGDQDRGQWSGLVLNGRAPINCAAVPGGTCEGEGMSGTFGGNLPNDSSGVLRYVRIEFAGRLFSPDNELNAFTMNGVGDGTVIEYVQCHRGLDDGFEWFGGTVNCRYLVATDCDDDEFDWQVGWRGKMQYAVARPATDVGDKGIEADNYEFGHDNSPRSAPFVSNLSLIGPGAAATNGTFGIHLRRGTAGSIINSIITNFRQEGIDLDDTATFNNGTGDPCVLAVIGIDENDAPLATRSFKVRQLPNPFAPGTGATIELELARPGAASVAIYDAEGRLVHELAQGELSARSHLFHWKAPRNSRSGTYFYRVEAAGEVATGKMNLIK